MGDYLSSCAVSFYFLIKFLDFPGSPVVKTLGFQSGGRGSIPGPGTKTHVLLGQKWKKGKENFSVK